MSARSETTQPRLGAGSESRTKAPRAAGIAFAESVALAAAYPAIGHVVSPSDPFLLGSSFSWLCVPAILAGLRHGFGAALATTVVLDVAILACARTGAFGVASIPSTTMLASAALAMACGQVVEVFRRDLGRVEASEAKLRKRLNGVLRSAFLLEVANERLESHAGEGAPNLREALLGLERITEEVKRRHPTAAPLGEGGLATLARPALDAFVDYNTIESASLHAVEGRSIVRSAVGKIGGAKDVDPRDPLVRHALGSKKLAVVPVSGSAEAARVAARTNLLAAVPFVDIEGVVRAVLCIEAMPLAAFDRRNLQTLFLLGGHLADLLASSGSPAAVERGRRAEFHDRLERAIRDLDEHGVPSFVLGMSIAKGSPAVDTLGEVLSTLHHGDFPLVLRSAAGERVLLALVRASDDVEAEVRRVRAVVERELRIPLADAGARIFARALQKGERADAVRASLLAEARVAHAEPALAAGAAAAGGTE